MLRLIVYKFVIISVVIGLNMVKSMLLLIIVYLNFVCILILKVLNVFVIEGISVK